MIYNRLRTLLLAILVSLNATVGVASQLYSSNLDVFSIDQNTGAPTKVMDTPIGTITDLASNGQVGNQFIWAVSGFSNRLAKLRPVTGEALSVVDLDASVMALAIDPNDSSFYGVSGTDLVGINPLSGEVTTIASFSPSVSVDSLAFDTNGNLLGVGSDSFFTIDTDTASVSIISNSVPAATRTGLAVRPTDGTVFLATNDGGNYQLFTVDRDTGARTLVGNTLVRPNGLAFAAIPEPSSVCLLVLSSLTAAGLRTRKLSRF